MFIAKHVNTDHKDLIHDVAFDFYGRRMATCSSDQNVKVFFLGSEIEIYLNLIYLYMKNYGLILNLFYRFGI